MSAVSAAPGWEGLPGEKGLVPVTPLRFDTLVSLLLQNVTFGVFLFFGKTCQVSAAAGHCHLLKIWLEIRVLLNCSSALKQSAAPALCPQRKRWGSEGLLNPCFSPPCPNQSLLFSVFPYPNPGCHAAAEWDGNLRQRLSEPWLAASTSPGRRFPSHRPCLCLEIKPKNIKSSLRKYEAWLS